MSGPMTCTLEGKDNICIDGSLLISFKRTLRLPNEHHDTFSVPDLGTIPLTNASSHADQLPADMQPKSGLLLPMHQSDAAWVHFAVKKPNNYLIKTYVDGINAISGEPATEDESTRARRKEKHAHDPNALQDYIVVPEQLWLDGHSDVEGNVQQFALPLPSAERQGQNTMRNIQFEITPYEQAPPERVDSEDYVILVRTFVPRTLVFKSNPDDTIECLKRRVQDRDGIPVHQQRMLYVPSPKKYIMLDDTRTLSDYEIPHEGTVQLIMRLHGGADPHELKTTPEGKRTQVVNSDPKGDEWRPERTVVFNVHLVGPTVYRAITERDMPFGPLSRETYQGHGVQLMEEFGDMGDAGAVEAGGGSGGTDEEGMSGNDGFLNAEGPYREFRTLRGLKKEYGG